MVSVLSFSIEGAVKFHPAAEESSASAVDSGALAGLAEFIFIVVVLAVTCSLLALWIANFFGLVRSVKSNNASLIVLHSVGIVVGLLGSVMGAIYFFKWRHEPLVIQVNSVAGGVTPNIADELSKLAELRAQGVITNEEFESQKTKLFLR